MAHCSPKTAPPSVSVRVNATTHDLPLSVCYLLFARPRQAGAADWRPRPRQSRCRLKRAWARRPWTGGTASARLDRGAGQIVPPSYRPRTTLVPPSYHPRTALAPPSSNPRTTCLHSFTRVPIVLPTCTARSRTPHYPAALCLGCGVQRRALRGRDRCGACRLRRRRGTAANGPRLQPRTLQRLQLQTRPHGDRRCRW